MNSSNAKGLALIGLIAFIASAGSAQFATGFGLALPLAPASLAVTVFVIGVAVMAASIPILNYRRKKESGKISARPNPFYAVRVLLFARAAQITATGFLGWHLGLGIWLVAFTPATVVQETFFAALLCFGGLLAALLAEWNCKAPKDGDENEAA
ncbi:MAG: hypothetical protein RIS08_975 [Actinomycetota bacterium]|jgi:hypothetical protein